MDCAACGTTNAAGSKFCMSCGQPLEAAEPTELPPPPPEAPLPAPEPLPAPPDAPGPPEGPGLSHPQAPAWTPPPPPPPGWAAPPPPAPAGWGPPGPNAPAALPGPAQQPMGPSAPSFVPAGPPDPNGLGAAAARLSFGARRSAKAALLVAAVLLEAGELVECVAAGRLEGEPAVAVLTDRRVVLANERAWVPAVSILAIDQGLVVQGWQDSRTASLTFISAGRQYVLEQISDKPLAVELAGRIRARTGAA